MLISTAVLRVSLCRAISGVTEYFNKMPWGHCCDVRTACLGEPHHGGLPSSQNNQARAMRQPHCFDAYIQQVHKRPKVILNFVPQISCLFLFSMRILITLARMHFLIIEVMGVRY